MLSENLPNSFNVFVKVWPSFRSNELEKIKIFWVANMFGNNNNKEALWCAHTVTLRSTFPFQSKRFVWWKFFGKWTRYIHVSVYGNVYWTVFLNKFREIFNPYRSDWNLFTEPISERVSGVGTCWKLESPDTLDHTRSGLEKF